MNERTIQLYKQAVDFAYTTAGKDAGKGTIIESLTAGKFAELIVAECRNVVTDVYHKTPLELCGPLLTADEEIMNHFYGVKE